MIIILYYPIHPFFSLIHTLYNKVQLFPRDFEELKERDMEFFFCRERPILGMDALPHPNPRTIFVPQLLDIREIRSEFSGRSGFEKHFGDMLGDQTGKSAIKCKSNTLYYLSIPGDGYFESVICGPLQGMYAWHTHWMRYFNVFYGSMNFKTIFYLI